MDNIKAENKSRLVTARWVDRGSIEDEDMFVQGSVGERLRMITELSRLCCELGGRDDFDKPMRRDIVVVRDMREAG